MSDETLISQLKHPITGAPAPVVDVREEFAALSKAHPRDQQHREAFVASRRSRIETSDRLTPSEKAAWLARLRSPIEPPPSTVGIFEYGFSYLNNFNLSYVNGSAITYQVICPNTAGGNVANQLYLTATNRTSLGVEAYVNYFGAGNTGYFSIYDWNIARTDPNGAAFALDIFFLNLGRYFISLGTHGQTYQTLYVHNATFQIANSKWTNQALLFNALNNSWDLIYSSTYQASFADQQSIGAIGWWGPVVESHEAVGFVHKGTNTFGFMQSQVSTTDGAGNPVNLILLDPTNSTQLGPGGGFQQIFLNANYDWAVNSP